VLDPESNFLPQELEPVLKVNTDLLDDSTLLNEHSKQSTLEEQTKESYESDSIEEPKKKDYKKYNLIIDQTQRILDP
jgi:hypothetical protein